MSRYTDPEFEMSCDELRASVDDLLSKELPNDDQVRLFNHAACCEPCRHYLERARQVQRLVVQTAPEEPMSDDFSERVFREVDAGEHDAVYPLRYRGFAVAAVVLVALILWPMTYWKHTGSPDRASATLAVWEPEVRQVRLAFSSDRSLDNVRLTLDLPDNVELEPFPGRQSLSWHVNLSPGDNLLTLPLRVLYPAEAELVATLDDGKRQKTFRTPIPGKLSEPEMKE